MQSRVKPTPQHHTTEPEPHQPSIHSLTRVNKFRTQQFDDLSLNPSNEHEPLSYQNQIKEQERLCVLSGKLGVEFNGLGFVDVDPELDSRTFDTKWAQ